MSSGSSIAGLISKYETLTQGNFPSSSRPSIWLDEAPKTDGSGNPLRTPFVVLEDGGVVDGWASETEGTHTGTATMAVYATLADADMAMAAILWNGLAPNTRAGIAFMTLDLTAPLYGLAGAVQPTRSERKYAGFKDHNNKPVYRVAQTFETMHQTRGTG